MNRSFRQITSIFADNHANLLLDGMWGIERESQRVTSSGDLALTPHPGAFGNKLENTLVTTDFSESQLELITPPFYSIEEMHSYLRNLQDSVENELKNEFLWPLSMPPKLPAEEDIPIARFDDTPEGREKEIYRLGLAQRYGKKIQMISGIHFNFSFGNKMLAFLHDHLGKGVDIRTFTDDLYFAMSRNFLRYRWLLIFLFGASPSVDPTYYSVIRKELKIISKCCPECCNPLACFEQDSTSLRVSRFGYSDSVQGRDGVSFNSLSDYTGSIRRLLSQKSDRFSRLGLYKSGRQIQLNSNVLQKESEFYSSLRLKQNIQKGETQLDVLEKRGVKYAEVRIIDLNPFEKTGIGLNQLYFLQVFMLYCLFENSSPIDENELDKINKNHHLVSLSGRRKGLMLYKYGSGRVKMKLWSKELFDNLNIIADLMDKASDGTNYKDSVQQEYKKVLDPCLLPSAMIEKEMSDHKESYHEFGIRKAKEHRMPVPAVDYIYCPVCEYESTTI